MSLWLPHGREPSKHLDLLPGLLRSPLTIQWIIVFNIPVFQWTENAGVTDADLRMKTANCIVETMGPEDWEAVKQIYEEGIATRNATVETDAPAWERWNSSHRSDCRLVAKDHDQIVGWAALSPVSVRDAYSGVAEVSVYVAEHFRGNGAGKLLLDSLISSSELSGVWTLQAMIFVENEASIALHTSCGFRSVGTRERIGCLYGHWRDTLLMERRSDTIGY